MQFYVDKFLRQRQFWETWQKKIFNYQTHNMNYYDDYVGSMDIIAVRVNLKVNKIKIELPMQ